MESIKALVFRNRYTVLLTTLAVYILTVVIEGAVTGRDATVIDLENPFFDLQIQDFEEFRNRDDRDGRDDRDDRR